MKAIKKQYKKVNWIDTRFSRHYNNAVDSIYCEMRLRMSTIEMCSKVHCMNVANSNLCAVDKKIELSNITTNMSEGIRKTYLTAEQKLTELKLKWLGE